MYKVSMKAARINADLTLIEAADKIGVDVRKIKLTKYKSCIAFCKALHLISRCIVIIVIYGSVALGAEKLHATVGGSVRLQTFKDLRAVVQDGGGGMEG